MGAEPTGGAVGKPKKPGAVPKTLEASWDRKMHGGPGKLKAHSRRRGQTKKKRGFDLPTKNKGGRPKGSGGKPRVLTPADIKKIEKAIPKIRSQRVRHRSRCLFFLGLGSGLRIHEMVALKISDVMLPNGDIKDTIQLGRNRTKSNRARNVSLSPQAQYWLHDWIKRQPKRLRAQKRPLFPSGDPRLTQRLDDPYDVPISEEAAKSALKRLFALANVYGASSHSLRATHGTKLLENGVDITLICKQLGHSSVATTQRYLDVKDGQIQKAVSQLQF